MLTVREFLHLAKQHPDIVSPQLLRLIFRAYVNLVRAYAR